jgi:CTP:molybdopterin cytidylyltransferase MocA
MVKSSTAAKLIQASSSHLGKMLVPRYNGEHGHPFLVPRDKFPAFTEAMEGKTARDILHEHASSVEYIDVDDPAILADVDTLEDLARFSKAPDSEDMD